MERGGRNLKETDSSPFFRLCKGQKMMRVMPSTMEYNQEVGGLLSV